MAKCWWPCCKSEEPTGVITLRKYTGAGSLSWNFRQPNDLFAFPAIQDLDVDGSGNIIAGGDSDNDGAGTQRCLFYLNSSKAIQWSKSQADGFFLVRAVAFDSEGTGDVLVAYRNTSGVERLARLDATGTSEWDVSIASPGITIRGMAVGAGGDIFVAGQPSGGGIWGNRRYSGVDGSLVWQSFTAGLGAQQKSSTYNDVSVTADSVYFCSIADTNDEACLWRSDHDGVLQDYWKPTAHGDFGGEAYGVAVDSSGAIILGGQLKFPSDLSTYQLVKLTRSGSTYSVSWKRSVPVNSGGATRQVNDVAVDASNDIFAGGTKVTELNTHGKYSGTDGSTTWEKDHGQDIYSVASGPDDSGHFGGLGA